MKIRIFDHASGYTGYSRNISGLAMALADLGVDIKVVQPKDDQYLPDKMKPLMIYNLDEGIKDLDKDTIIMGRTYNDIHQFRQFPHKMICTILVLEGDRLPEDWIAKSNMVDQVWASSTYNRDMLIKNGCAVDIKVIHHGFDPEIYWNKWGEQSGKSKEKEEVIMERDGRAFTFLFVGGFAIPGDRKGADILAIAFNAFNPEDNVKLIFKINTSYNPDWDGVGYLRSLIEPDIRDKVEFITEFLDDQQMADLYRSADVAVTPTMGEAFCQSILEAMACGTKVRVTNWSGHLDYCIPAGCGLIPIKRRILAHYGTFDVSSGSMWVEPDTEILAMQLRIDYNDREGCEKMGKEAANHVHSCMTWKHQAEKTLEAIRWYLENFGTG